MTFETSSWKIIMLFKLLWRYKFGPINMRRYMQNYLVDFLKIYNVAELNTTKAFYNIQEFLDLTNLT